MAGRGGGIAGHVGAVDLEVEREMGEDVGDMPGRPPVGRERRGGGTGVAVGPRRPGAGRHLAHAAQQALVRALAQQHRAVGAHGDEGRAAAPRPLGLGPPCTGKQRRIALGQAAAVGAQRAEPCRPAGAACRSWRRDPSSPGRSRRAGACRRQGLAGLRRTQRLGRRQRRHGSPTGARPRVRHCRRSPAPAGRRRSRRSPRPCRRRCRAAPAAPPRCRESGRRARRPRSAAQAIRLRARE